MVGIGGCLSRVLIPRAYIIYHFVFLCAVTNEKARIGNRGMDTGPCHSNMY
jgi:hypothetical protein